MTFKKNLISLPIYIFIFIISIIIVRLNITNVLKAIENKPLYVSTAGADISGNGSFDKPLKTIQYALDLVQPGTTIYVQPGIYKEHLITKKDATSAAPITLKALGKVIVKGVDNTRIFDLFHDYYIIEGFEFDGGYNDTRNVDQTIDKLLWVETANFNKIRYNYFHHARGECIRNLFFSEGNSFEYNTIENCGLRDFVAYRGASFKNGEGIYIGVAPEQIDPTKCKSDQCRALIAEKGLKQYGREVYTKNNIVTHNFIDTHGNECVDIKEGSSGNMIADNVCISQYDAESAAYDTRGPRNSFIHNTVGYSDEYIQYINFGDHTSSVRETGHKILGAAFRAGGDGVDDAILNNFVKNKVLQYQGTGNVVLKVPKGDRQNVVCQNEVAYLLSGGFSDSSTVVNASVCPSGYQTLEPAGARGCIGHLCYVTTSTPSPTFIPSATPALTQNPQAKLTPTPTAGPNTAKLKFKIHLPDVVSSMTNIPALDVQVKVRDGTSSVGITNVALTRSGNYFQTAAEASFNISQTKVYSLFIKTKISIGRLFNNVTLTQSQILDCTVIVNPFCGELITARDSKLLISGDSDGFTVSSGSYNKVDSADLQLLATFFNQPATGPASAADFNLDSTVDISDLEIFGKNYGQLGD